MYYDCVTAVQLPESPAQLLSPLQVAPRAHHPDPREDGAGEAQAAHTRQETPNRKSYIPFPMERI